jgi:hypothetical protein
MNDYEKESIVPNYKDNQNFDKIEIEDEPASNEKTEFKNKPETSNQKTPKANENSEVTASENNTTKQKTTINEDKVNENSQKNKIESKNSEQQKKETLETTIQTPSTTNTEAQAKREELSPPLLTEKVHLVIDALETIKVLSITDGKTVTRILEPGETLVLEAKKSLEVSIDKGGLANITLNNNDKGILGTLGEPLKLKFP